MTNCLPDLLLMKEGPVLTTYYIKLLQLGRIIAKFVTFQGATFGI